MTLLRHIEACNRYEPEAFVPFMIGGAPYGRVTWAAADQLASRGLAKRQDFGIGVPGGDFASISRGLAAAIAVLAESGLAARPRGEMMPVMRHWGAPVVAEIDRSGLPALGLPAFGVHVNGYVRKADGIHLWIGRRAADRLVAPGKLDHLVAGGITSGYSAAETVIKESGEEANLSDAVAQTARPVSLVSYCLALPEGLRRDTLFIYDLELSPDVTPASNDGEVEAFSLMPVETMRRTLRDTDDFKFNVNLALIDFMIRHGFLGPDSEPEYEALVKGLRR